MKSFAGETVANNTPVPAAGGLEDEADGCLAAACPDAPTGTAVSGPLYGQITVSWSPAATGGSVSTWDVKYATSGDSDLTSLPAATRTHTFTGLDPAKVYSIVVQGVGAGSTYGDAAVARNVRPLDAEPAAFVGASVDGGTLTVNFDRALEAGSTPAGSAFTLRATPARGARRGPSRAGARSPSPARRRR